MESAPIAVYVAGFVARCEVIRDSGQREADAPGLLGLLPAADGRQARLLVTDDRAHDPLAALLPDVRAGMISVFAAATRCAELVARQPGWRSDKVTSMVCRDLRAVPAPSLPDGLTVRSVRRLPDDGPDGVALEDAVAAAAAASPVVENRADMFVEYLRSLPSAVRLYAAIDSGGTVRATSGAGAYGAEATVMFVNTDPDWRGRGIGHAMTAAALRAALDAGARRACLDSSDAGLSIYLRLGFEAATLTTRFFRDG